MFQPTTYVPVPELESYVASYGIIEIPDGVVEPYFSPPLGLSGFIIQVINTQDMVIAKLEDKDFFTENAVVTGQVTQPVYGQLIGKVKSILVFFSPFGMHQLFGNNMAALTNKAMPLSDFIGREQAEMVLKELRSNQVNEEQINVLNRFLSSRIPKKSKIHSLEKVLALIHQRKGDISVKEMETNFDFSRRTLERQFRAKIGLSPREYAQIYQFKCLINLLKAQPTITWTELANQAGYFDQSHMSRYVKEFLKVSPNSIVNLDMELISYLLRR